MIHFTPGYRDIKSIYEGWHAVVYRGIREQDGKPVVIKLLKSEYPSIEEITELKHEYEITKELEIEGVVRPYSLVPHGNRLALVVEDFGGESLALLMERERLAVKESLEIAIQIVEALGQLHQQHIIHKDIKPQNIVFNHNSRRVKIIDFGIASRLSKENPTISNAKWLEGTLAYISPEQTARMNRSIDYRTDFYSLGVTLYEMLTGKLPFVANDALELIHCHIAKPAVPPRELEPDIPQAVADIVMKLLAKNAEGRYQSAAGLKYDLEACLLASSVGQEINNFAVGQRDLSAQFLIPQKLYGREKEVGELMAAFASVAEPTRNSHGSGREMMLVAGYSGIGKSSLVNEVHKPIVEARGYFISGKFDQFKRNIPYSAVVAAFQGAIGNLLRLPEEDLARFRGELLEALGPNGRVMIEVIPELELIVGSQPPVPELGLAESGNRFNRVFQRFVGVFAKPEHPLVIFLDDLQWADSASLKSIELLLVASELENLLLLGAYRDNEVSPAHPLMLTLEDINKAGATVNSIEVKPLLFEDVSELVADTLYAEADRVRPLAELVFNKTQGNPFFLTQLLETLHAERLLSYSFSSLAWEWDITEIQGVGIADYGIVELIARNIQKLSGAAIAALKYSACIGNQFDLDVLATIQKQSKSATALDLWPALQAGLILPLSDAYRVPLLLGTDETPDAEEEFFIGPESQSLDLEGQSSAVSYRFLHDRVQQAAYSLIPENQRKETHLKIGKELLANASHEEIEDKIFDLVNQLNVGADSTEDRAEKERLAGFNLMAGRKAKASMAYEPAVEYLNAGLGLLEADSWESQYDLTLALHVEAAEANYLSNSYSEVAALVEEVLGRARSLIDKIKTYELQIESYLAENQLVKAIDTGLAVLDMLDCPLPNPPEDGNWVVELPSLEEVEDFPEMTDPRHSAALRLMLTVTPPAYLGKPEIVPVLALTEAKFCIEFGHSARAAYAYALYGLMAPMLTGNVDLGYHAGQLALKILEKFKNIEFKCKVYQLFNSFVRPWKEHIKDSNAPLLEGLHSGLETGDLVYVGNCATIYCSNLFLIGEPLESVKKQLGQYVRLAEKIKQDYPIYYLRIWRQLALNLMGEAPHDRVLIGESFDESVMVPKFQETKNYTLLFMVALTKTILLFLLGEYENALEMASLAAEHSSAVLGMSNFAIHNFYYSLALLSQGSQDERGEEYSKLVEANQLRLQQWASSAPTNFEHKYLLVEAERARALGQNLAAIELYDRAISLAKERGYVREAALANELAARFYFSTGRSRVGRLYLTDAYYGYINWGALAAAKNLERRYPTEFAELFAHRTEREEDRGSGRTRTEVADAVTFSEFSASAAYHAMTVMRASRALADEIVLSELVGKLLEIVMESALALTGSLVLEKDGNLVLKATRNAEREEVILWPDIPIETSELLPKSAVYFTFRSGETMVLSDASQDDRYKNDPYIAKNRVKSILCLPIAQGDQLIGVIYLENNLTSGVFTPERLEMLEVLSSQAAISLNNALLYARILGTTKELEEALAVFGEIQQQSIAERAVPS